MTPDDVAVGVLVLLFVACVVALVALVVGAVSLCAKDFGWPKTIGVLALVAALLFGSTLVVNRVRTGAWIWQSPSATEAEAP